MILTLTGPNGSGKTTIARRLIAEQPNARMLLSYTTRDPRPDDISGEYTYLDEDAFARMHTDGVFEWTAPLMRGRNYGTTHKTLDDTAVASDVLWIAIIVPECMTLIYDAFKKRGAESQLRSVFISSPGDATLKQRLMENRQLSEDAAMKDVTRCLDWESQARGLDIPFIYIEDRNDLEEKYQRVAEVFT